MNRGAADAIFIQLFRQVVGPVFGTGEDQHLLPVAFANHLRQQFAFTLFIHHVDMLRYLLRGSVAARDFDFQRVGQQFFGQRFNFVGEGGGEQQVLTLSRQLGQHATDVMDEAHIQHAVGFIKHQNLNLIEFHGVLMFQIQQAAWGCHQHVHAATQFHHLWVNTHTTENHQRTNVQVAAVFANVFANLRGQLTGWGQDQRTHRATALHVRLTRNQRLQQRQGKTCGFAGTGLRARHQISALQYSRNRLLLNGGGFLVALLSNGTQNFGVQSEGIKRHKYSTPTPTARGVVFEGIKNEGMTKTTMS